MIFLFLTDIGVVNYFFYCYFADPFSEIFFRIVVSNFIIITGGFFPSASSCFFVGALKAVYFISFSFLRLIMLSVIVVII